MPEGNVRLRNRRQQPVELHLPGGVLVLPPHGETLVAPSMLATPQLAWLVARKALAAEPEPATAATPDPAPATNPEAPAATAPPAVARPRARTARDRRRAPKP